MTVMAEAQYRLSFTAGGLLVREAEIAALQYKLLCDWTLVRAALDADNLLQARTAATGHRLAREVAQRLTELADAELDLLLDGTSAERGQLMWVAACRRYRLLGEFAEEVLRERFLVLAQTVDHSDFDSFVRTKTMWHEELAELKDSTYRKLRSNVFLMMHEVGILDEGGLIVSATFTNRLVGALRESAVNDIRFFPTNAPATLGRRR